MNFFLIPVMLFMFSYSQAIELQAKCDFNNYQTCDLTIKEFVIGDFEFDDEELALDTYTSFCRQNIKKHLSNSKIKSFKIREPIQPDSFCFKYEKLYDVNSKSQVKKPHLFYQDSSFTASFQNRTKYFRKEFKAVLKTDQKTFIPESTDIINGIKKVFSDCKEYTKKQLRTPGVIFSYCDDGFKGITHQTIGVKEATIDFTPIQELLEDALRLVKADIIRSKKTSNNLGKSNIWETSIRVKAYTFVSKDFIGKNNIELMDLRPENFFINGFDKADKPDIKKKPSVKGTLQKVSDAVDKYNKFTQMFGRLIEGK